MGFMQKWTEMTIGSSAYACQLKYHLSFREALERSLVETRPGWTRDRLAEIRWLLDGAKSDREMIRIVAKYALEHGL